MRYLITLILAIVTISINYRINPDAPTKVRYDDKRYIHKVDYSGDFMIIKIKYRTSGEDVRVYIYDMNKIYGYEVN